MSFKANSLLDLYKSFLKGRIDQELFLIEGNQFYQPITTRSLGGGIQLPNYEDLVSSLNENERNECRNILDSCFRKLFHDLDHVDNWEELQIPIRNFTRKSLTGNQKNEITFKVSGWIEIFTQRLEYETNDLFQNFIRSNEAWDTSENIILFQNEEIKTKVKDVLSDKSRLQKVKILTRLRTNIEKSEIKHGYNFIKMDFRDRTNVTKPYSIRVDLLDWIKVQFFGLAPEIEFRSLAQIKILRKQIEILGVVVNPKISTGTYLASLGNLNDFAEVLETKYQAAFLVDRFDQLIGLKSTIRNMDEDIVLDFRAKEAISNSSSAASIVRFLVYGITGMLPKYRNTNRLMELKIWISVLFYGLPGFSYDDIRKSMERNQHLYK